MLFIRSSKWLLTFLVLWLIALSSIRDLSIPDEGRYGDISRWMVESGDWLIPRLNGLPFLHKPPLLHWLSSCLMELFGVHIWVLRLIPVSAAIITLFGLFWFVKKHVDEKTAQLSVLVLATSLLFYGSSQYINHDLLVACWITITILCLADFTLSNEKSSLFFGYVACGLGFLSKGLIGILIPGMVLLPWILAIGEWRKIPKLLNPLAILLLFLIVLPWPLMVEHKYSGFLHYFFIEQQFNRFSSSEFNNKQPWIFYIVCLIVSFLPWLILTKFKIFSKKSKSILGQPTFILVIWWAFSCIVFFSIPPSKLAGYILPATAPLAILIAVMVNQEILSEKSIWVQRWGAIVILVPFTVFLLIAPFTHILPKYQMEGVYNGLIFGLFLLFVVAALTLFTAKRKITALSSTLVVALSLCVTLTLSVKIFDKKNNADQMTIKSMVNSSSTLIFYNQYYYDVPFLLNTQKPIYIVGDWNNVKDDSTSMQLRDGLRFEPNKKKYLIEEDQFHSMLMSNHKLIVFADKGSLDQYLNQYSKLIHCRNFDVYIFNAI